MEDITFKEAKKLAKEFLATKPRDNYYGFTAIENEYDEEVFYINKLSDEEVSTIRSLKEKYGEKFVEHLDEVFDDADFIFDLTAGDELIDIDLNLIYHKYGFTIHELQPDGTLKKKPCKFELSDEEYIELLAWQISDKNLSINSLRHWNESLYDQLLRKADCQYWYDPHFIEIECPYLLTFDEAKIDSELIVEKYGIKRTGNRIIFHQP